MILNPSVQWDNVTCIWTLHLWYWMENLGWLFCVLVGIEMFEEESSIKEKEELTLTSLQRWSSDFCKRFHPKVQLVERNHLLAVWGFDPKLHRCWPVRDQAGSRQRSGILFHEVFECIKTESAQILKESQTEISLYKGKTLLLPLLASN